MHGGSLPSPRSRTAPARSALPPGPSAPPSPGPSVRAGRGRLVVSSGGGGRVAVVVLEDHAGGREDVGGGVLLGLEQADRVLGAQQVTTAGLGDEERRGDTTPGRNRHLGDRKSTRLNSSHVAISYAVFCLKKKRH